MKKIDAKRPDTLRLPATNVPTVDSSRTSMAGEKKGGIGVFRSMSSLLDRLGLGRLAGLQFDGARDLYKVYGYKDELEPKHFLAKYSRQDIVTRIIDAPAKAIWSSPPTIKIDGDQEAFDEIWLPMIKKHKIWAVLSRADKLAQLGRFSILLMGIDDTQNTKTEVTKADKRHLLYLQPFGEVLVAIDGFENDPLNERFGLPTMYKVSFDDPSLKTSAPSGGTLVSRIMNQEVHHSRIIHVVTDPLEDQVFSTPIIAKIYNLLDDLMKIVGGTAETYWLTANRGIQADIDKDMQVDPDDAQALADEIDEYQHQLRRVLRTRGVKIQTLGSDIPAPQEAFSMIINLLSGTTGIPQRILLGSEAGQLASEQDRANWADRIDERRAEFAEPLLLRPFIDSMMVNGILPESEYVLDWPDAFKTSPLEESERMAQQGRAIFNISKQKQAGFPIVSQEEARIIVGLDGPLDPVNDVLPEPVDDPNMPSIIPEGEAEDGNPEEEDVAGSDTDDTVDPQNNPN